MDLILWLALVAISFGVNECSNQSVPAWIPVILVNPTPDSPFDINSVDFAPVSEILTKKRNNDTKPADYPRLSLLEPLLNRCFLQEDSKYYYRVCLFSNVTQHEKSRYTFSYVGQSFHSVLGIWRQWLVVNNTFGPLIYLDGDKCDNGQARKVAVHLLCSHHQAGRQMATVRNVTELHPCIYNIELESRTFCDIGTVYSHLDPMGQSEWNLVETLYHRNYLTQQGYEHYAQSILNRYGLTLLPNNETITGVLTETSSDLIQHREILECKHKVRKLEIENEKLKEKLKTLES